MAIPLSRDKEKIYAWVSDLAAGSAASRVPSFHLRDSQRLPQAGFSKLLGHDSPDVSALLTTQKSA